MIEDFVRPQVEELENVDNIFFMQDGATRHTCMQSKAVLREMFPPFIAYPIMLTQMTIIN